ncbi:MAG: glycosyltransferase family 39 protein [Chloroflexota bacterium]
MTNASQRLSTYTTRLRTVPQHITYLLIGLLTITSLGALLRFYHLGFKGLWGDEIWTANRSVKSPLVIIQEYIDLPGPFYYLLSHFSLAIFGQEQADFALRFPAALAGVLVIPAMYILVSHLYGRTVGIISTVLIMISPYQIWYSQEARFYTWLTLLSLISTYCILRALDSPKEKKFWIGFIIASILNLYNQPLSGGIVLISQGFFALFQIIASQSKIRSFISTTISFSIISLLYSPVIYKVFISRRIGGTTHYVDFSAGDSAFTPRFDDAIPLFLSMSRTTLRAFAAEGAVWGVFFTFFLVGSCFLFYHRKWKDISLLLIPFIISIAVFVIGRPSNGFILRYVLFLQPLYLICISLGIVVLAKSISHFHGFLFKSNLTHKQNKQPTSYAAICVITLILFVPSLQTVIDGYSQTKFNDWRSMVNYLNTHVQPGDTIIGSRWTWRALPWYFEKGDEITYVNDHDDDVLDYIDGSNTIWYILMGPSTGHISNLLQSQLTPIPHTNWEDPEIIYDYRFTFYPMSEYQGTLYVGTATAPSEIQFEDIPASDSVGHSYRHVEAGHSTQFDLVLASQKPRQLTITHFNTPNKKAAVYIDDQKIATVGGGSGGWVDETFLVPSHIDSRVSITVEATGIEPIGISKAALSPVPSKILFNDIPRSGGGYRHIGPGQTTDFHLALSNDQQRNLYITFTDLPEKQMEIRINGEVVDILGGGNNGWHTVPISLPSHTPDAFSVSIKALGEEAVGVSDVRLKYATSP